MGIKIIFENNEMREAEYNNIEKALVLQGGTVLMVVTEDANAIYYYPIRNIKKWIVYNDTNCETR